MKFSILFSLLLFLMFTSCRKDEVIPKEESYHILIVGGQSNTHYGKGFDPAIDTPHEQIFQLGRHNGNDYQIIQATHPLDHHSSIQGTIGFVMTFSKLYANVYMKPNEKLLIIPGAKAGSAFTKNDWNKGNKLYVDLVERVTHVMEEYPTSHIAAMLWHQGESDMSNDTYQADLDAFIHDFRTSIGEPDLPFILGGMNPFWVNKDSVRIAHQEIIKDTPNRVHQTAYADPSFPIIIQKDSNENNSIHYDAPGQRELGVRYFLKYPALR